MPMEQAMFVNRAVRPVPCCCCAAPARWRTAPARAKERRCGTRGTRDGWADPARPPISMARPGTSAPAGSPWSCRRYRRRAGADRHRPAGSRAARSGQYPGVVFDPADPGSFPPTSISTMSGASPRCSGKPAPTLCPGRSSAMCCSGRPFPDDPQAAELAEKPDGARQGYPHPCDNGSVFTSDPRFTAHATPTHSPGSTRTRAAAIRRLQDHRLCR